jgi:hypothetical protein
VQLLHSRHLIEGQPAGDARLLLPAGLTHTRLRVVEVHVAVLDEVLSELPHALRVFGLTTVSDNAGTPSGLQNLRLREHVGGVDVDIDLRLAVGIGSTLA